MPLRRAHPLPRVRLAALQAVRAVPVVVPQRALHARERVFARPPLPLARGRHRGLDPLERAREVEPAPRHRGQQPTVEFSVKDDGNS